jgi:hypothetical protein
MFSTKARNTIIGLIVSTGFAGAAVAPAVSQAQWHTIVVGGQVITHGNFTEGGVSPCTRIGGQLGSARGVLGDDKEWLELGGAGKWMAGKEVENAEAAVLRAEQEAFENGCDIAPA